MPIPKRPNKLMRGLSDFVKNHLSKVVTSKDDILTNLQSNLNEFTFGQIFTTRDFKKVTDNFTEEQWQTLIARSNQKIKEKIKEEQQSKDAMENITNLIAQDDVLKHHNISIVELVAYDKNYYVAKTYLICGAYFLEGSIKQIISDIRCILKDENIDIHIFCPNCSSKNLRFADTFCLCNECGSLSIPEENKVVKKYEMKDKPFWWAQSMADIGLFQISHKQTLS